MSVIKCRNEQEKLQKFEETKNKLMKERLEEKLSNRNCYHYNENVFEHQFNNRKKILKQKQKERKI